MRRLKPLLAIVVVALGLAGCSEPIDGLVPTEPATVAPTDAPPPTAQPSPSVGPLVPTELTTAKGTNPGAAEGKHLNIPEGWTAEVWANVPGARLAAWDPNGSLLVSTGGAGTVTRLTPTEPGTAPEQEALLTGLNSPQGLAFALNDKFLVVGEADKIVKYEYANGTASNPTTLVDRLPTSGHGAKGVAVSGSTVYYSVGSEGNRETTGRDGDPQRATVWQVGINGDGNQILATGVRNGMALAIAPDKTLFTAVNGMDNVPYPFNDDTENFGQVIQDFVNENPVEAVTRLEQGTDLGWPFCLPDTRDNSRNTNIPYVNDAENNPDGESLDCGSLGTIQLGLPAHSAPLGLTFTAGTPLEATLGSGALITAHGSWNREPPQEPYVAFAPWDDATGTLGPMQLLVTGWQSDAGDRWGRSVASVVGPDGSLYVTDDAAGLVYRISPN